MEVSVLRMRVAAVLAILAIGVYATTAFAAGGPEGDSQDADSQEMSADSTDEADDNSEPEDEADDNSEPEDEADDNNESDDSADDNSEPEDEADDNTESNDAADDNSESDDAADDNSESDDQTDDSDEQDDQMDDEAERAAEQAKDEAERAAELAEEEAERAAEQRVAVVKEQSRALAKAERAKGEQEQFLIYVNGQRLDLKPVVMEGRTLVPFRSLAEFLGATVSWDQETQTVTMLKGDRSVVMAIGSESAVVNGAVVPMPLPAQLVEERTFVPLRFIATALGADVDYEDETGAITVVTPEAPAPATAP